MAVFDGEGYVCKKVFDGEAPVDFVYHENNGVWQMLCSNEDHSIGGQALLAHPRHVVDMDRTLLPLADLPLGFMARRDSVSGGWIRSRMEE